VALPALAELTDIEDRLGRELAANETSKVVAALSDASAVVRAYTRRTFTKNTTTTRLRPRGNKVTLPDRPVISVDALATVFAFAGTETITPTPAWSFVGGFEIHLLDPGLLINGPTLDLSDDNVWCQVTYTHGFEEIPEDIVAVVANMVVRGVNLPGGGLIDSETIGPYTTRYNAVGSVGPLSMTDGERRILNNYRATSRSIELR